MEYTQAQFITNMFRSVVIGFCSSVLMDSIFIFSATHIRPSILPGLSALIMLAVQVLCIVYDLSPPSNCYPRVYIVYGMIYASQLCLEIYQTQKVHVLSKRNPKCRYLSYFLFFLRLGSLGFSLFYYKDGKSKNGVCHSLFEIQNLVIEKVILLLFNAVNIGILIYLFKKNQNIQFQTSDVFTMLLVQDGFAFVVAFALDAIFVVITALFVKESASVYSMTSALGNAVNVLVLYLQNSINIRRRLKLGIKDSLVFDDRRVSWNKH